MVTWPSGYGEWLKCYTLGFPKKILISFGEIRVGSSPTVIIFVFSGDYEVVDE